MGAVFTAASRAPITAVLILFELTGDYMIGLPLMVAVVLFTIVSRARSKDSNYTVKLSRRGIDRSRQVPNTLKSMVVDEALEAVPVHEDGTVADLIARFVRDGLEALSVVDHTGSYRGIIRVTKTAVLVDDDMLDKAAGEFFRSVPTLRADQSLQEALFVLLTSEQHGYPLPLMRTEGSSAEADLSRCTQGVQRCCEGLSDSQPQAHVWTGPVSTRDHTGEGLIGGLIAAFHHFFRA